MVATPGPGFVPTITNIGIPVPSGSTPIYTGKLVDVYGNPIGPSQLDTLTLTICDTLTQIVINNVQQVNILNVDRGTLNDSGILTITLLSTDTLLTEAPGQPSVQRSLVIDWKYNGEVSVGRHQVNFNIVALAGA
jgi:hypothetical protein